MQLFGSGLKQGTHFGTKKAVKGDKLGLSDMEIVCNVISWPVILGMGTWGHTPNFQLPSYQDHYIETRL